jgi:hypothetical protein
VTTQHEIQSIAERTARPEEISLLLTLALEVPAGIVIPPTDASRCTSTTRYVQPAGQLARRPCGEETLLAVLTRRRSQAKEQPGFGTSSANGLPTGLM